MPVVKLRLHRIPVDILMARLPMARIPPDYDVTSESLALRLDAEGDYRSLFSLNGVRVTEALLASVGKQQDSAGAHAFRVALVGIKAWARSRGLYGHMLGYLGGVNWAILVATLSRQRLTAAPGNPQPALYLLRSVLYAVTSWKWPMPWILDASTQPASRIPPGTVKHDAAMPILTPVRPTMDSAHNVTTGTLAVMREEALRAWNCLNRLVPLAMDKAIAAAKQDAVAAAKTRVAFATGAAPDTIALQIDESSIAAAVIADRVASVVADLMRPAPFHLRYRHYLRVSFTLSATDRGPAAPRQSMKREMSSSSADTDLPSDAESGAKRRKADGVSDSSAASVDAAAAAAGPSASSIESGEIRVVPTPLVAVETPSETATSATPQPTAVAVAAAFPGPSDLNSAEQWWGWCESRLRHLPGLLIKHAKVTAGAAAAPVTNPASNAAIYVISKAHLFPLRFFADGYAYSAPSSASATVSVGTATSQNNAGSELLPHSSSSFQLAGMKRTRSDGAMTTASENSSTIAITYLIGIVPGAPPPGAAANAPGGTVSSLQPPRHRSHPAANAAADAFSADPSSSSADAASGPEQVTSADADEEAVGDSDAAITELDVGPGVREWLEGSVTSYPSRRPGMDLSADVMTRDGLVQWLEATGLRPDPESHFHVAEMQATVTPATAPATAIAAAAAASATASGTSPSDVTDVAPAIADGDGGEDASSVGAEEEGSGEGQDQDVDDDQVAGLGSTETAAAIGTAPVYVDESEGGQAGAIA